MSAISWLDHQWAFTAAAWLLGAGAVLLLWVALFKDRSRGQKRCPRCWYDMTGVPALKCPECAYETVYEGRFYSTRRRWKLACVSSALLTVATASLRTPRALDDGVAAAVPIPVLNWVLGLWSDEGERQYEQHIRKVANTRNMVPTAPTSKIGRLLIASRIKPVNGSDPRSLPTALQINSRAKAECMLLQRLGAELRPALPTLIEFAGDTNPEVRRASVDLIGACALGGCDDAAEELKALCIAGRDADMKVRAIQLLSAGVYTVPRLRPALLEAVTTSMIAEHSAAGALALGASATNAAKDLQEVQTLLHSTHANVRLGCLQGLLQSATPQSGLAENCCRLLTHDPSPDVRIAASQATRKLYNGESMWIESVERGLHDSDAQVRSECLSVLIGLTRRTPDAVAAARKFVQSDAPPSLRGVLLPHVAAADKESRGGFLRSIANRDASPEVRAVALRVLFEFRTETQTGGEYFASLLSDPAPAVTLAAANCLGRLGKDARPQLDALKRVRSHPDGPARAAVEDAITRIE